ncbi:MAG: B12-binding domain-containing protein [Acidobacteriota bacterium]
MKALLSPRDLAEAIGVSESSIKRWADDGVIQAERTAGGHRRIPITEAVRYLRESRATLSNPAALGLEDVVVANDPGDQRPPEERLFEDLRHGRSQRARGLLLSLFLEGASIAQIVDGPLRIAMRRVGELWLQGEEGIFREHRATDITIQGLHQIRSVVAPPPDSAMAAVGGAPTGDPYMIPSLAVSTLLEVEGFRATNLGPETPSSTLLEAVRALAPKMVWISISTADQPARLSAEIRHLLDKLSKHGVLLMLGGKKVREVDLPAKNPRLFVGDSMAELAAFARGLAAS